MESRRYPTDLSDDEWCCIGPHLPEPTGWGRPRLHGLRAILDAVFYALKSGCPCWRLLPRDFPPWKTVYRIGLGSGASTERGRAAFGFKYNEDRDGLVLDAERMVFVKRMFYMAGVEGRPIYAIKRAMEAEGVPTPTGKKDTWDPQLIRRYLLSDLYKPHTFDEIRELVSPEVAATLDSEGWYGVWWWGRSRVQRRQVSEPNPNGDGRRYRYRYKTALRPREDGPPSPSPTPAYRESGWMRQEKGCGKTVGTPTPEGVSGSCPAAFLGAPDAGGP